MATIGAWLLYRSVPSGFGVLVSVLGSLVVRWAKLALTFGDPTACSKWCAQVGKELSIDLAALLESLVKWVYTVSGWLVGGSNLQLSFPNDGIAGLGPALCCRGDTSWVSGRVVAYWIPEAVGALCFKVWVAFLSGSSRQPVPAPLTPVPLGLSRA
ncbi:unnamed protein product [Brassica oleracea var. botrytis]